MFVSDGAGCGATDRKLEAAFDNLSGPYFVFEKE